MRSTMHTSNPLFARDLGSAIGVLALSRGGGAQAA